VRALKAIIILGIMGPRQPANGGEAGPKAEAETETEAESDPKPPLGV